LKKMVSHTVNDVSVTNNPSYLLLMVLSHVAISPW
jgi:hypothetical protein